LRLENQSDPYQGQYQAQIQAEQVEMQKKNIKSNVVLQPLNYRTNGNSPPNLDDVMRNQFMENHPLFSNQPQSTNKKGHLEKLNH